MKITKCDKCGLSIEARNVEAHDWHSILDPRNHKTYVDLCPTCYSDYSRLIKNLENRTDDIAVQWLISRSHKSCANCKYADYSLVEDPCDLCSDPCRSRDFGDWYSKWEPKGGSLNEK